MDGPTLLSVCSRSHLTTYAKQNGGKYNFIVEDEIAIPQDKVCFISCLSHDT